MRSIKLNFSFASEEWFSDSKQMHFMQLLNQNSEVFCLVDAVTVDWLGLDGLVTIWGARAGAAVCWLCTAAANTRQYPPIYRVSLNNATKHYRSSPPNIPHHKPLPPLFHSDPILYIDFNQIDISSENGQNIWFILQSLLKEMWVYKMVDKFGQYSPPYKLSSIIKMLPILDNMCAAAKHWQMFYASAWVIFLSQNWAQVSLLSQFNRYTDKKRFDFTRNKKKRGKNVFIVHKRALVLNIKMSCQTKWHCRSNW